MIPLVIDWLTVTILLLPALHWLYVHVPTNP